MGRSPTGGIIFTEEINSNKAIIKKGPWTPEEDRMLVDYIEIHGHGSWRALPKLAGLNRCGKSCRLRWTNYLRPDIRRGNFTEDEEKLIILLHSLLGNKWSAIATHLSGRTDNEIKNYWNTHLKKKLLQMGIDPVTHQPLPTTNDLHRLLASAANLNLPQLLSLLLSNNQLYTTPSSTAGGYGMLNSSSSLNMDINNNINAALIKSRSQYYPDANHFAGAQSMVNYNLLLQFLSSPDAAASTNTNISTTPVPIIEAITGLLGPTPTVPLFDDNHQLLEYLTRLMKNPEQSNQLLGLSLCNDGTPSGLPDPYPSSFPSLEELLQQCSTAAAVTCNANTNYSAVISNSTSNYQLPTSGMSTKPLTDHIGLLTTAAGGGSGKEKYDHVGSPTSCSSSIIPRFETIPALVSASSLKPTVNNIASTQVIHDDQTSGSSKMKPITTNDISRSNPAFSTISIMLDGWEDRLMNDEASDHDHESYWKDLIECNTACQPTGFNSKFTTRGSTS